MKFLMSHHPSLVVGGIKDPTLRSQHLQAFWEAYKENHPHHPVFREHEHGLCRVIPMCYHGDEGRGKRRGNTTVLSMESVLGIYTGWNLQIGKHSCTSCCPPPSALNKFPARSATTCGRWDSHIEALQTNMKGHSYLQRYPLYVLPGAMYKEHRSLLDACLSTMSLQFRQAFFDGFEDNQGHVWFLAIVGFKGDLKFFARAGYLQRSFEHVGRVRNLEMCHECLGGSSEYPFEEVTSDTPKWIQTIYSQRPWVNEPPLLKIPYHPNEPERQMKKDCFHLCKVGIYRDFVACSILWLLSVGYFGHDGDVDTKLGRAYKVFYLFCSTTGRTPGLRSFNKNFFNFPKLSSFGWANTKGSDTMHLVAWIKVLCVSCKNDLLSQEHLEAINLISFTADAASTFFRRVNSHGLFLTFHCGVALWADLRSFIRGYAALAHLSFTKLKFPGFSMKPKLHLLRHLEHDIFTILSNPNCRFLWNPIAHGCEMNEDFIGRACRLSRKCSTQLLCQRVLQSILLKADFLNRRWQQFGPRSCGRSSKSKAAQRIRGK